MVKVIPIELYKRGVLIFFGEWKRMLSYLRVKYPDYYDSMKCQTCESASALTYDLAGDAIIYSERRPEIPVLVHEITHAARIILEKVDISPFDNDEVYAYLVEYISKEAFDWLGVTYVSLSQSSSDET